MFSQMKSIETEYKDELLSLDIFEYNVQEFGQSYIDDFYIDTKQQFEQIFKLQNQMSKDIELTKLFAQFSDLMGPANLSFAKISNRLMELKNVILSYFSCNQRGSSLRKYVLSYPSCFDTLKIIKLTHLYLENADQESKLEPIKQDLDLNCQLQNCDSKSPDKKCSKLSKQDEDQSSNPFLSTISTLQRQQSNPELLPLESQVISNSLPNKFAEQLRILDLEILKQNKSQENLKSFSSILLSSEETKSEYQIFQQFGTSIKRALWVIEDDEVYKAIKCQDICSPIFFTKQPNQDIQFGFGVQNYQEFDKKNVLNLKDVQVKFTHTNFVEINGQGFKHISYGNNKLIEKQYQQFLETKENNSICFSNKKDAYKIEFCDQILVEQGVINSPNPLTESYTIEMVNQLERPNCFDYIKTFDRESISNSFSKGRVQKQKGVQLPKAYVIKIEKIINKKLYERFVIELKFMSEKYPQKDFEDIMQHLFHGSYQVDPILIYNSSIGFDFRLSKEKCFYGRGAYFAKNSGYSDSYSYIIPTTSRYQIFVALVLTGDSITLNNNEPDLQAPPYKPGSNTERYDSVHNGQQDHFVVYDHYRAYPGYLITYETV
eukprot:403369702